MPPGSDVRDAVDAQADDWLAEEIDWSRETGAGGSRLEPVPGAQPGDARGPSRVGLIPAGADLAAGRPVAHAGRFALIRRRRMAALAAFGLLLAAAVVVPLVVFEGGQNVEQTTALPTTASPVTTPTQPATTPTRPATTPTGPATTTTPQPGASGAAPLRVALPKSGTIRRGDRGSAVVKLQKALAAIGYAPGKPDGIFGQVTEAAVIDFQQSNNLTPDGVVGGDTAGALNTALARRDITE